VPGGLGPALDEAAPLRHPGVHPHRCRRRWTEFAPPACPGHAFGSHGRVSGRGFWGATGSAPPVGEVPFVTQLSFAMTRRSKGPPCGK
jgi:hypothetical protein